MSDYPMLISNKLHSFRNFMLQIYMIIGKKERQMRDNLSDCVIFVSC